MGPRLPALGFRARMTLTIAGAFIGAMLVILVLALVAARSYNLAIISVSSDAIQAPESATTPRVAPTPPPPGSQQEPPAPGEPPEVPQDVLSPGEIYTVDQVGEQARVVRVPAERLPTLVGWSLAVLLAFAILAVALAWWISGRSLGRIAGITSLARGLSERHLDQRLNLTGPDDEIKRLGDTFDGMLERLERVFTNQSLFIANASHELRTPLTTARAALEIPLAQGRVPNDLRPSFERALAANQRSEELISALLLLARGRLAPANLREVDLREVVRSRLAAVNAEARAAEVTVNADLAPATVRGNPTLLAQAVANLVENAVRHNVPGGDAWVTLASLPSGARLTVANTGSRYTPADVARLVEPFHRHDATRTSGPSAGFGLGLAIVDGVASTHGGALVLTARAGGGLVATLDVPSAPPEDEITPAQ